MSCGRTLFSFVLIVVIVQNDCQIQPRLSDEGRSGEWNLSSSTNTNEKAREEKLRSALIDAFQTIKNKGGISDDPLNSDLIGTTSRLNQRENASRQSLFPLFEKPTTEDSFDKFFSDDDGLSFADAGFKPVEPNVTEAHTEKSHNVQHIIKTTKRPDDKPRSTNKPHETIITRISDSIRTAVNETRNSLQQQSTVRPEHREKDLVGLENMLQVFDAELLLRQWPSIKSGTSQQCRKDMEEYVNGLVDHRLWALKMDDASGRYTSAFYWGNNYWTGSAHLCASLRATPHHDQAVINTTDTLGVFGDWREDTAMYDATGPPFNTAFYMLKMQLNTTIKSLIRKHRTIHLGLCLPYSCTLADVGALVSRIRSPGLNTTVLNVRSDAHSGYNLVDDFTFQVLIGVSTLVAVLLTAGTWYDMRLSRQVRRARRRASNMAATQSDSAGAITTDLKLDLNTLDNVTMTNGKAIYNVNNNITLATNNSEERLTAESPTADELKLSIMSELLLSFSMKTNIRQIFDQTVGADTIPVVHGLRSLSMVWVIMGHACIVAFKYADNTELRKIVEKEFSFQIVISAVYSVDTFFCLGGLLVSFLYFRSNAKGSLDRLTKGRRTFTAGVLQFLGLIGYRFARLTAPYLFMLGVVEVTMKWFHFNSVFEPPTADHETCPKYWWRNILYINTLFPVEQMCMLWSWYLSDDSQFYALSAILLILATSHFKLAAGTTVFFFFSSLITTGYISWSNDHIPNAEDPFTSFDKIYDKPWTRLGPYLVGMITGWILFKTNLRIKMSKVWVAIGWISSMSMLLFLIFGLYSVELDVITAAVYASLSHTLWAACIAWIIIACSTGYGGWLHRMLSAPVLYPFSRVTYCAYLVHPVVIRFVAMHLDHPLHLGKIITMVLFLGMAVISYVLSFIVSVAFEAPMVTMLKILSPHKRPHKV